MSHFQVLMAGGTTRIKHLQRMIEAELKFGENKFNRSLSCNTDKVVAIGAAVYAAKIASQLEVKIIYKKKISTKKIKAI